ncbi:hypothetical protein ACQ4LE_007297 [Meloidogyne hapla]|uniref:Prohormone-4 n=1 Tax=Meloidogyne hapla TaxID=6305 RepID=A0A1I8B410_MELHA
MKQSNVSLSSQLNLFSSNKFPKIPKNLFLLLITLLLLILFTDKNSAFSIRDVLISRGGKRTANGGEEFVQCPTWHPFQCPNSECIPIKYLCDGSPDCSDEYDENSAMCTAAIRPPVEETVAFLKALLQAHGKDFLEKLFGEEARNSLAGMGGVDKVAVALSQSPTLEAFGVEMKMSPNELARMASVLQAIISSDENSGFTPNEAADFRFFVQKLQETGFF